MSNIEIAGELLEAQLEIQEIAKQRYLTGDESVVKSQEFIDKVISTVNDLETFLRRECLINGNYITNDGKRFTGKIALWIFHDMNILALSKTNTIFWITRAKSFIIDTWEFLKQEALNDGTVLSVLFTNARELYVMREKEMACKYFDGALQVYLSIEDTSKLDWLGDAPACAHFMKGLINIIYLNIESDHPDRTDGKAIYALEDWMEVSSNDFFDVTQVPFIGNYTPARVSFFNRIFNIIKDYPIYPIEKLKIVYQFLAVYPKLSAHVEKSATSDNLDKSDTLQGNWGGTHDLQKWAVLTFPEMIATTDVSDTLDYFKDLGVYDTFIQDLSFEFQHSEDIFKILGIFAPSFISNLKILGDERINEIFEDKLLNAGFPLVAYEITGKEYKDMEASLSARVLTLYPSKDNPEVEIYFNQKEGSVEVSTDTETWLVTIHDHLSSIPLDTIEPINVYVGKYEKALVTPR